MKPVWHKAALAASAIGMAFALSACGDRIENTEMAQTAQAAHPSVEMDRKAEPAAAPKQQQDANAQAAAQTTVMGAAPAMSEDQRIAGEISQALKSDPDLGAMKIDVHSEFGLVTLRGRAPDSEARDRAGQIARNIGGVKTVDNMLTLG